MSFSTQVATCRRSLGPREGASRAKARLKIASPTGRSGAVNCIGALGEAPDRARLCPPFQEPDLLERRGRGQRRWPTTTSAFDVAYAYNPSGDWTARHQMSLNGKVDDFTREDFRAVARAGMLKRGRGTQIVDEVIDVVSAWPDYAARARVTERDVERIHPTLRLSFPTRSRDTRDARG